jgi:putative tryptophan/tyrosine transport system substrate-binding protein
MQKGIVGIVLSAMLFALCFPAEAQQPKKVPRIGWLTGTSVAIASDRIEAFRQGLRELGYVEGKNIVIIPELAAELVRLRLDCILAVGVGPIRAVKQLTDTIPIVIGAIDADPVDLGFIASLARPSGNITGFTGIPYDIAGKRLDLLKETVPKASRAAILVDPSPAAEAHVRETERASRNLRMQL